MLVVVRAGCEIQMRRHQVDQPHEALSLIDQRSPVGRIHWELTDLAGHAGEARCRVDDN